jgi:DNA polymerase III subunit gamma/tau
MSLALYRTYRPSRLSEVIGQEHVTEPLRRALESGRVHHAYLFSGPRGCGKTSTARILARSLLCERGPTAHPCGECDFCVALAPNGPGLIDVIELDAASHGGVDDTRELRERAVFVPAQARFKIYIIDEAHMVSKDGFNALLKLIEEPPDHVKFIFATTEVDKVLPTIRSRTFNYTFRLVPVRQLQQNLAGICEAEQVPFEPVALNLIARASGGSVRDAQSIMGQLIAGAGAGGLTQAEVAAQLGVTDEALLDAVTAAVADHDGSALFTAVEQVVDSGHDVRRFATDLLHRFRDLLVIHHAGDAATADVLDVSEDRRDSLVEQARRFGPTELTRYAEIVNDGLTQIKGSTSPRLQLEILAAQLLVPSGGTDPVAALARVEVLERRIAVLASAPATASPAVAAAVHAVEEADPIPPTPTRPSPATHAAPAPHAGSAPAPTAARVAPAGRPAPPTPPRLTSLDRPATQPAPTREPDPPQRPAAAAGPSAPAAGAGDLDQVVSVWPELMEQVRQRSRVAAASWEGAAPASVSEGTLFVRVPSAGQAKSIKQSRRDLMLHTALVESFGIDLTVQATSDAVAEPAAGDLPSADDPDLGQEGLSGVDLAVQALGATKIGEIEGQ